ncbi:MAG TPA: beta-galactosidase, partial [Abditibacteriaceae bacterium]|nr:beta-galactosidase [Abditibacteriaceae bacterium]
MITPNEFPLVEVLPHNGAPALFIDGQPVFPLLLMTGARALEDLKEIAPCAIHLLTDTFPLCWTGIGRYDFNQFDAALENFLKADPQAMIMPRIHLDAPQEWMDAHPDEVVGYADPAAWSGDTSWGGARHPSWASRLWRNAASEALRELVRHVKNSDYASHILGWHLGSGIYGEWHYWNAVYYPDTSPAFVAAYRDWLAQRYPKVMPEPRTPTIEERRAASLGVFRDPANSRWFIDHAEFFHLLGDQALAEYSRVVKQETDGRSLVLAFNGYLPDLDVNREIDHRAFDKTLRNPDVDSFASPHSYTRRAPGDDAPMRGFMGSVRALGKLWFDEADERTSIAHPTQWKHVTTMEESVEVLWRSFAHALTHNCGLWFMDQGGLWFMDRTRGWYQDKAILDAFAAMGRVGAESMQRPRTRVSEVAVVASFKNAFYLADRSSGLDQVTNTLINPQLEQFVKSGAPFDIYLITELFEPTVPPYRVYAFLDTFFLTDDELAKVKALRDAGKTLLFFYAPGFLSENSISLERMRDLLGMDVQMTDSMILPDGKEQRPGFIVPGANGAVAQAGNVFYCPAPPLPAARLRGVLQAGGVHSYLETDDPLMVGGGYIGIHAASDGQKSIHNPVRADWANVRTGETLARHNTKLV